MLAIRHGSIRLYFHHPPETQLKPRSDGTILPIAWIHLLKDRTVRSHSTRTRIIDSLTQSGRRSDGPVLEPCLAKIVGAVIKLNPLLAPPPGTQDDYLRWNMLCQTSNCYRTTESQRYWVKGRNAPATHPRLTCVRVISRTFPWMIQVRAHNSKLGVTCGEVLDAISTHMYANVAKKEYENLPQGRKRQIWESYRFNRSTDSNAPGGRLGEGLKRLDWLGSSSMFGGLVVNDTFVKEHCGDLLHCTFEVKCLSTYPLMAEEVREQQRRLENPRHHRSRGRGRPASQQWPMTSGMPADLDDEQSSSSRARLAHEHPNDLNSSPSSPWSETPTYFDSRYRSGSSSHLRSHTATSRDRSRSSHLLACLVSLDEEQKNPAQTLQNVACGSPPGIMNVRDKNRRDSTRHLTYVNCNLRMRKKRSWLLNGTNTSRLHNSR
ncbi:hypothetical protein OG21DRAFT_1547254 [Imleria badia]|nr:hypothetical protein OG21DRAFT_1547254 [Imleria badia]